MEVVERKHAVVLSRTREHTLAMNARMHTLQRNHFLPLPPSPEKKEKKKHGSHNRKCSRSWRMKKRSGSQLSSLFPFHLCLFSIFPTFHRWVKKLKISDEKGCLPSNKSDRVQTSDAFWQSARAPFPELYFECHRLMFLVVHVFSSSAHYSEFHLLCDGRSDGRTDGRT